uniref:INO80 complex subunit E N-terminal domain-containing protein n=1 Tax=Pinctada fucata TaxID=50426 RepID=A0A194AJF2_PINFU
MKPSIKAEPMWYGGPQGQSVQVIRGAHGSILGTRMSTGITAGRTSLVNPYIRKWRRLKRVIKDLVYVNAAVCDEVVRVEEKIAKVKEERRFLLRKLLHYQSLADGGTPQPKVATTTPVVSKAGTLQVTRTPSPHRLSSLNQKPRRNLLHPLQQP